MSRESKREYLSRCLSVDSQRVMEGKGRNIIPPPERESLWSLYLDKFKDPIIMILLIILALSCMVTGYEYYHSHDAQLFFEPGGILLAIVLLSCHISLSSVSGIGDFNIPTAYVMKTIAPFLYGLYLFIIFGEIFTSLIGNAFGLERQLKKVTGLPSWSLYVCILGFCLLIGQVDYGPLISYLYPLFGYISLSFLVLLMFKRE